MKRIVLILLLILIQPLVLLVFFIGLYAALTNPKKAQRMLMAYDRLGNAAANDNQVMTISMRAAIAVSNGKRWGCVLCKLLDYIDKDHCRNARP